MLFAVDLVMVGSGKNRNDAGQTLRNLSDEIFPSTKFVDRQLSTRGGYKTKLLSLNDALDLIMVLPGNRAKQMRKQFKDIILRYLDGDRSMCHEIMENHAMGKSKSYAKFASKVMKHIQVENEAKAQEMPPTCYVYATKSPAFPGLIKIGKTVDVTQRLSGLNVSCAPAPHVIVAVAPTFDHARDEKTAHTFFACARREGEFFELEDADVEAYFTAHITAQYHAELAKNVAALQGLGV